MIDDTNNIKTNFLGKDGFRWWIGQVPPAPNHKVNWNVNKNWGLKRRVRIMGYHPDEKKLPDVDLPLAIVLLPPTAGTGAKNSAQSIYIEPGEIVLGFFLDGDDAQVPAIIASFGRTKASSDAFAYSGAFKPFTGYTNEIPKEQYEQNKAIKVDESNQETTDSQKSPVATTKENADKNDNVTISNNIGKAVTKGSACTDSSTTKVQSSVNNFIEDFKKLSEMGEGQVDKIDQLIKSTSKTITTGVNGLVGDISENVVGELTGQVQTGLKVLYDTVFNQVLAVSQNPVAAHLAGVAAQKAMVGPVGGLQKALPCMAGNVTAALAGTVETMLRSMTDSFDEVLGFPQCMADQFTGSLLNGIVDSIGDTLAGPLGSISKVLSKGYSITDSIRSKVDMLSSVGAILDCGQGFDKCTGKSSSFSIGGGISEFATSAESILDSANSFVQKAEGLAGSLDRGLGIPNFATDFSDPASECFGGLKSTGNCGKPKVRIFGGNGFGAAGEVLMGLLSGDIAEPDTTASVIGLRVTKPGTGYEFPPFVEIVDDCKQGYGAIGRALIKKGEVVGLYVVSEGEGYPPGEPEDYGVVDAAVDNAGSGYLPDDTATDQFGNEYKLVIDKGGVVSVKPLNINITPLLPKITINSNTGSGAQIRPILGTPEPTAEIKQVIDCIDPEENNLVGYVKGKPYYGPYHIHPTRGVKMVGIAHTTAPHEIIYDTPEQSFGTAVSVASTMTVSPPSIQANVPDSTTQTNTSNTTQTGTTDTSSQQTSGQSYTPPSNNPPSGGGSSGSGGGSSGGGGYGGGY